MYGDEAPSASMYQDQTALRIDIIPSDASESLLPQSFWIDDEVDWQNSRFHDKMLDFAASVAFEADP